MAIIYEITNGALPVTVSLMQGVNIIDTNVHVIYEQGQFDDIPEGEYELYFIDDDGCNALVELTTTTTTTLEPTTTTTTTILPEFIFRIDVGDETVSLPFIDGYSYDCTVDWGDGSPVGTITAYNDIDATHTYSTGEYIITILGTCEYFSTIDNPDDYNYNGDWYEYITEIINWGDCGFLILCFADASNLVTLPNGPITGASGVTTAIWMFYGNGISIIPSGLFDNMPLIETDGFKGTFGDCYLISNIPIGLFDNCTLTNSFNQTFYNDSLIESIPNGLFDNNLNVISFDTTFFRCSLIETIPSGLFNNCILVETFVGTFQATGITSIPSGLFDNNINVTSFSLTFDDCSNLASIPNGLFNNNTSVTSFGATFYWNTSLTSVPIGLFKYNSICLDFNNCFYLCSNLVLNRNIFFDDIDIDTRFHDQSINFTGTFDRTEGLGGEAPYLWDCDYGIGTPVTTQCFYNHSVDTISNYCDIPEDWKSDGSGQCTTTTTTILP